MLSVALFTGAWIETLWLRQSQILGYTSRPSRARGLKPELADVVNYAIEVAPFTGAWIETCARRKVRLTIGASRPSRARGLKL